MVFNGINKFLFTSKYTERRPKKKENNFHRFAQPYRSSPRKGLLAAISSASFSMLESRRTDISSDVSESESPASSFAFGVLVDGWIAKASNEEFVRTPSDVPVCTLREGKCMTGMVHMQRSKHNAQLVTSFNHKYILTGLELWHDQYAGEN